MTDREIMQPAPPECKTEEEKTAFAFGWLKAMEAQRLAQPEQKPMHPTLQKMWEGYFDKCYKREWVGLTDEEEERLIHNFGSDPHTLLDEVNARLQKRNTSRGQDPMPLFDDWGGFE